jgi:putative hydrolase of the HAD superfamily
MKAVILDVGGVLLVPHFETVAPALEPFEVTVDAPRAERAHYFGALALDDAPHDEPDTGLYLSGYLEGLGVAPEDRPLAAERIKAAWAVPNLDIWRQQVRGSMLGLRKLADSGVKLGIISNSDGSVEEQLRRGRICQIGDGFGVPVLAIIDSGVVGVSKPAAEIFRHALDPLGVEPEEALYIGDTRRYDVRGARAAGLVPVHFDPYQLCPETDDHAHVLNLTDVEALL